MRSDVLRQLEPLQPLDLSTCDTVSDIVEAMRHCSFGARMLGEVATTWTDWLTSGQRPVAVYDGPRHSPLGSLLLKMQTEGFFSGVFAPEELTLGVSRRGPAVVVGMVSERRQNVLFSRTNQTIFINPYGFAKPGQVRDGYYPDVVFSDPRYVMAVLAAVLDERIHHQPTPVSQLLTEIEPLGGLAHAVVHGAETFRQMVEDPDVTIFMSVSGAMTIAKMGLVICDMVDHGMVQLIASTGALMAHGLVEGMGLPHYKYNPRYDDAWLADRRLNRVTDTLEPEENLDQAEKLVHGVMRSYDQELKTSPIDFNWRLGHFLCHQFPGHRSILGSAAEHKVPILVPAFVDSELGNDVLVRNLERLNQGLQTRSIDPARDSFRLVDMATGAKRLGIFSIGGGVPRNYLQNVAPLVEIISDRGVKHYDPIQFEFGCRICPDPMWYGHLSGCTYQEGMSWRKMDVGGRFSEVHADATLVWPFYVKYVLDRLSKRAKATPQPQLA